MKSKQSAASAPARAHQRARINALRQPPVMPDYQAEREAASAKARPGCLTIWHPFEGHHRSVSFIPLKNGVPAAPAFLVPAGQRSLDPQATAAHETACRLCGYQPGDWYELRTAGLFESRHHTQD